RLTVVPDDDLADVADPQRALPLAVVVADLPAHQIAVERGAAPVIADGVRDVIEVDRLPARRREGLRDRRRGRSRRTPRLLRRSRRRRGRHERQALNQLTARHLPFFEVVQKTVNQRFHDCSPQETAATQDARPALPTYQFTHLPTYQLSNSPTLQLTN